MVWSHFGSLLCDLNMSSFYSVKCRSDSVGISSCGRKLPQWCYPEEKCDSVLDHLLLSKNSICKPTVCNGLLLLNFKLVIKDFRKAVYACGSTSYSLRLSSKLGMCFYKNAVLMN